VKDVNWMQLAMCCNICIIGWFRLKKTSVCVQEKQGCADHCLGTGFGIGPSRSELQKTKDTSYPVGALGFCLHAASLEIWDVLQRYKGRYQRTKTVYHSVNPVIPELSIFTSNMGHKQRTEG